MNAINWFWRKGMTITDIDGARHTFNRETYSYSWIDKSGNYHLEFCDGDHYTVTASEYDRVVVMK